MNESVFSTFNVEEKIKELKELFGEENIYDLSGKRLAIAVPIYDESMRNIRLFDHKLYLTQQNDLQKLCTFFRKETKLPVTWIITTPYHIPNVKNIDYLILLHEFMQSEEDNLIAELKENNHKQFKVYKLY